jgi:chromosome segregation ATPase
MLAALGLASAGRLAVADHRAEDARRKVTQLEERIGKLRADIHSWKARHQQAAAALAEAKKTAARAEENAQAAREQVRRLAGDLDESRRRADTLERQLGEMRKRVTESKRVTALAREHLMATEVKLDLIESAIQVLDARTRDQGGGLA